MDTNNQIEVLDNIPETPKKNKRIKYIIMIIVIVLCLGIGGLFYYKETVLFNKKKVIGTSINEVFNVLESNLDNINNSIIPFDANEDAIGIDGSIEASSNNIEKLKDYKISYNGAFNLKENKLSGYISIINNNRNLLSLKTYINGNHGLVESGQLSYYAYNYSIAKEIRDIKINNNNNYDNIKKVIKRTKDVIVGRVNENKITKDSVEISINGKNEKYTRFTYEVNINELANDILKFYITDTSMLNTLSEITSQDSNRVKEFIQYLIDNNKGNETIKYEVYVDSLFGKFKQLVVYNTNNPNNAFKVYELDGAYKYEINFDENKISGKYSNSYINVEVSNNYLSINKLNDDQYKIELYNKDSEYIYNIAVDIKITKEEEDKQSINFNSSYKYTYDNKTNDLNINATLNVYKNATVKPISSFITKDISTIDEKEYNEIMTRYNDIIENIYSDLFE